MPRIYGQAVQVQGDMSVDDEIKSMNPCVKGCPVLAMVCVKEGNFELASAPSIMSATHSFVHIRPRLRCATLSSACLRKLTIQIEE